LRRGDKEASSALAPMSLIWLNFRFTVKLDKLRFLAKGINRDLAPISSI